tara:strand:- start:208 stop:549 length:342 start_codon:yes stop_codon:yes gene_type:complete
LTALTKKNCIPCNKNVPKLTGHLLESLLAEFNTWQLIQEKKIEKIKKSFSFKNFMQTLEFTNKIGNISELEGHHPELHLQWGKVTVFWWTHKIKGLHENDFIMAKKTDLLYIE